MQLTSSQQNFGKLTDYTALASFGTGTLLLVLGLSFKSFDFVFIIGYFFVLIAIAINAILLLITLSLLCIQWKHWQFFLQRALILCANIPVTALYMYILFN
ncbi:hypothetical protein ABGT15_12165 [Flavobacterium enshiense]|uniref:hypothetical protein n=1 Tax=Flavobacterium enshiense TaxID=1341165 RepID=UPI00345DB151